MINLSRCLGALVVLSIFASACASAPSEGSAAQTNALSRKDPGAECPVNSAPICKPGETLRTVTSADGCQAPECQACPVYAAPICAPGETLRTVTNADGCQAPECQACPVYAAPICKPGETLHTVTNADGCQAPECR